VVTVEVTRVRLPEDAVKRLREELEALKRDIRAKMLVENYPLLRKLEEDPSPADWATFSAYLRVIHLSNKAIHPDVRAKISQYQAKFLDIINERLAKVGGYWVTIEEGDTLLNYYDEDEGMLQKIKLGYVDVMNILGAKNVDKVVDIIIRRSKGIFED
jgi:hypothetical protein